MLKIIVKRLVLIKMVFIILIPIVVQADPFIIITFLHPSSILPYLLSHPQQDSTPLLPCFQWLNWICKTHKVPQKMLLYNACIKAVICIAMSITNTPKRNKNIDFGIQF